MKMNIKKFQLVHVYKFFYCTQKSDDFEDLLKENGRGGFEEWKILRVGFEIEFSS